MHFILKGTFGKKNWSASLLKSRDLVGSRLLSPRFVGLEADGDFFPFTWHYAVLSMHQSKGTAEHMV